MCVCVGGGGLFLSPYVMGRILTVPLYPSTYCRVLNRVHYCNVMGDSYCILLYNVHVLIVQCVFTEALRVSQHFSLRQVHRMTQKLYGNLQGQMYPIYMLLMTSI